MKNRMLATAALVSALAVGTSALADDYIIDSQGAHASINFKIKHLGYSWLTGRFDTFGGQFNFDPSNPAGSKIVVDIDTASVNSNHAERDKHLRSADFLNVDEFPDAKFESTSIEVTGDDTGVIKGDLTLHGVTRPIAIDAEYIGGGDDPWGGFRQGFAGTTELKLADFGIDYDLGPASRTVELELHVEGIRQ